MNSYKKDNAFLEKQNPISENLNQPENQQSEISNDNLFVKIWLQPTKTYQFIFEKCPEKYVTILLVLGGIVRAIDRASVKDMGDKMSTAGVLTIAIIMGGLLGWITYYIYAWSLSVTGKWLNGSSDSKTFRTIIAWALIPSISTLILLAPQVAIFGDDLFKSEPVNNSLASNISLIVFGLIELTLGIWTLIILVKGIKLVQNFSTGKAIGNLILSALLIVMPLLMIGFLIATV